MKKNDELFKAIMEKNPDKVKTLLDAKADVNMKYYANGQTPLMYAVRYECLETIKRICEKNPDKQMTDSKGKTVFDQYKTLARTNPSMKALLDSILLPTTTNPDEELKHAHTTIAALQKEKRQLLRKESKYDSPKTEKGESKVESMKIKTFKRLVENGLRDAFTIAKAIEEERVRKSPDSVDKVIEMVQSAAPAIQDQLRIQGVGTGITLVAMFIQIYRRKRDQAEAGRIVKAFTNDFKLIDDARLETVSDVLAKRYSRQILQLKITVRTTVDGSMIANPGPGDSVFILAKAIVKRVIYSIVSGENEYYPKSRSLFSKEEKIPMPIEKRCIMATAIGNGSDDENVALATEMVYPKPWTVEGVLDYSGRRVESSGQKAELYIRSDTDHPKYGFIVAERKEARALGFQLNPSVSDPFANIASVSRPVTGYPVQFFGDSTGSSQRQPLLEPDNDRSNQCCCIIL